MVNRHSRRARLCAAGLFAFLASTGGAEAASECGRACLEGVAGRYLEALTARDPAKLAAAAAVKYTENGQSLPLGDGLWATANGAARYTLVFADAAAGQVGVFAVIEENGVPAIIATRLKVEGGAVSEIESVVARSEPRSFGKPENLVTPHPLFLEALPTAERLPRDELIRIANTYFTGLDEEDSGRNVPFDPDCQRIENGVVSANSKDPKAQGMQAMGCKAQFDTGFSVFVTDIRDRRFLVVDEERGLVYAVIFFDHAGNVPSYTRPDGQKVEVAAAFRRPFSFLIGELFKIKGGKIRQIEAVLTSVPYRMPSGW